jgi:hypothetical protein
MVRRVSNTQQYIVLQIIQPGFLQEPGHPFDIVPSHGKRHLCYIPATWPTVDLRRTSSIHHCYNILCTCSPSLTPTTHGVQHATEYTVDIKSTITCQHSGEETQYCGLFSCSEHNCNTAHIALPKWCTRLVHYKPNAQYNNNNYYY